ncbi:MAG: cyclic nucleotide-binding domain-containing protein [gamma proteobacterium symbiont of Taylorina sp.]|nr:cyclic nucleotide-binding domain-containing protein [gamma proteobacterium symbiont of Taylorina sp.]
MAAVPKLDVNIARKFYPFDSQSIKKVQEIIEKSAVQKLPADRILFKQGDKDKWTIYLLSGKVELTQPDGIVEIIEANTEAAIQPISNQVPRTATVKSHTEISVLIIDRSLLQLLLNHNDGGVVVGDLDDDEDEDWMSRFLQSNAFLQLPAANIQSLMMSLQEQPLEMGETIIQENSPNDDKFYIIQEGSCIVTKTNQSTGKEITLAQLDYGTGFGEEALITGGVRGASVSMKTDGIIMTLEKKDFLDLLVAPLIHRISNDEVDGLISSGDYQLIDVRNENEFSQGHLEKAEKNIPISLIRSQLEALDEEKHYIIYSNQENRSSAAAFLFIQQGFECSIIAEGIEKIDNLLASEPAAIPEPPVTLDDNVVVEAAAEESSDPGKHTQQNKQLTLEQRCKKTEALAATFKAKAQEAIKFAKVKAKQLELIKQKLHDETLRADNAEAELEQARKEIEQLKLT